jgi:adenine-specific DNA-methyltransferase
MNLDCFKAQENFYTGLKTLFNSLNIPVNYIDEKPLKPQDILLKTYKDKSPAYQLMNDVYILGMVDDKAFEGAKSADISEIKKQEKDYDGIVIFGVTLTERENGLLPTRTQLAEVTRAFNREFYYTPVVVIFRYDNFISLASAERLKYKHEWLEGEKAGKVSILRDIEIENPHTGHLKILEELKIARSGKKGINSFEGLYQYWQEVFSVNLLNKKFYSELSNWYFWAIKHVKFPSESQYIDDKNQQYKAQNVIRMLTRLLFVWFIKEKKLIPEELFDLEALQKNILKKISPFNEEDSLFKEENRESIYYKAILQNLFFATLNCPIDGDGDDKRKRGFRLDDKKNKKSRKSDFGVTFLMRYKKYFQNPDAFLGIVNEIVPFLNGGLFECLDIRGEGEKKEDRIFIDGFSENIPKEHDLIVPDYLFFGREEKADLSSDYGTKNKGTKEAAVKGLINILKSYKFTIAENTPIEEDVALDPELLGKVFENLLASYNPETKTTARKQTGSFYTPREIVNYMVDESLIAHLKNSVSNWDMEEKELDEQLHKLVSFEPVNPFENNTELSQKIIHSLDNCKILDPACGSGAFPMGILQKMVHILQKVDPDNEYWRKLQLEKAQKATEGVFIIKDKEERKQLLDEINEAFDETINNPDYARKLFLIENCIYGVDIQPIAAQISKLRFFISLVVEQKVNKEKDNFGIRPLPNLETKFVTANTLIGIDKPDGELFYTKEVQEKEAELKAIRHKLFGAKTKSTKVKYRKKDEELRNEIADILKKGNLPVKSAEQLAGWDPYDQNGVSPFFDPEWMFDIKDGFDIVIGNPPYGFHQMHSSDFKNYLKKNYQVAEGSFEYFFFFYEKGLKLLSENGTHSFIAPVTWLTIPSARSLRKFVLKKYRLSHIVWLNDVVFENAQVNTLLSFITFEKPGITYITKHDKTSSLISQVKRESINQSKFISNDFYIGIFENNNDTLILNHIINTSVPLGSISKPCSGYNPYEVGKGMTTNGKTHSKETIVEKPYHSTVKKDETWKREIAGRDLSRYKINITGNKWIKYGKWLAAPRDPNNFKGKRILVQEIVGGSKKRIIAAYCSEELYYSRDVIPIRIISNSTNPYYFLAIINSSLITWYHHKRNPKAKKGLFPKVLVSDLKKLPIKSPIDKYIEDLVACIVSIMIFAVDNEVDEIVFHIFDSLLDGLIFELYFPDHMKERKIDVLQFVEKDIEEVMQDNEFETLNDAQKEQVITELHNRWSAPNSEIVKRMSSFSEK